MTILIVDPLHNSPGMHDDDGAFEIAAEKLAAVIGADATRFSFDNTHGYASRLAQLRSFIIDKRFTGIVEVSHGQHARLQSGIDNRDLDVVLHDFALPRPTVAVLLACSAASQPIESSIAYALAFRGVRTIAHVDVGHAYLNPHLVDVQPDGGGVVWDYIVKPHSTHWRAWVAFLRKGGWIDVTLHALGVPRVTIGLYEDELGFMRWAPPLDAG